MPISLDEDSSLSDGPTNPAHRFPVARVAEALRFVARGDTLSVATVEDGTLLGRFQSFDGEVLVLTLSGDTDADIPSSAIRAISRLRYSARDGARFAWLLGAVPLLLLVVAWLTDDSPRNEGLMAIVFVAGLGGAIHRKEPLFLAPRTQR